MKDYKLYALAILIGMNMKKINILIISLLMTWGSSCSKYLDIVPDNVATLESAFSSRITALRYLVTCYAYMPQQGHYDRNPAFLAGDELILGIPIDLVSSIPNDQLGRGHQNKVNPYMNFWDGDSWVPPMFQGIRAVNIFLENIAQVPDVTEQEKIRWTAEAKFLKAYYHFWLFRMYGPIPLIRENLPISASAEAVKLKRESVDDCVAYMVQLLDEAAPDLPEEITDRGSELGRITKPIALSLKAKLLVYAASPLFNGNAEMAILKNPDSQSLFNEEYDSTKWHRAVEACKEAIDLCHRLGYALYYYKSMASVENLTPGLIAQLNVRSAITDRWNTEVIWGNPNSLSRHMQVNSHPKMDMRYLSNNQVRSIWAPTLKMVETFYSENGVPIDEDKTWDFAGRYSLRTAEQEERFEIRQGYTTAGLNFNREPRFYANLGFDGGMWYGHGKFDAEDMFWVEAKSMQAAGGSAGINYSATGYFLKKIVHYENVYHASSYTLIEYPWPVLRLGDLYLLYAEALHESGAATDEVLEYVDRIRTRAGLKGVRESWENYSINPTKVDSQTGLRDIIRHERLIEMAFEGSRYWDLRRWKLAPNYYNDDVRGWDIQQEAPELYYRTRTIFTQKFSIKDYFWPIRDQNIIVNRNLVQNLGW